MHLSVFLRILLKFTFYHHKRKEHGNIWKIDVGIILFQPRQVSRALFKLGLRKMMKSLWLIINIQLICLSNTQKGLDTLK
uniref:Dynamin-2A isoform X2 n=1 Tax=Rhizophora mucronata TaxID=61149 RepID=A0A2P2MEE3_RHIMU